MNYIVTNPNPDLVINETDVGLVLASTPPDAEYFTWSYRNESIGGTHVKKDIKEAEVTNNKIIVGEENEEKLLSDVKNRISSLIEKAESLLNTAESLKAKKNAEIAKQINESQ